MQASVATACMSLVPMFIKFGVRWVPPSCVLSGMSAMRSFPGYMGSDITSRKVLKSFDDSALRRLLRVARNLILSLA
jgi:hypothetical protein